MSWRVLSSVAVVERPPVTVRLWRKTAESSRHGQLQLETHGHPGSVVASCWMTTTRIVCARACVKCARWLRRWSGTASSKNRRSSSECSSRSWLTATNRTSSSSCCGNCSTSSSLCRRRRLTRSSTTSLVQLSSLFRLLSSVQPLSLLFRCRCNRHSLLSSSCLRLFTHVDDSRVGRVSRSVCVFVCLLIFSQDIL